MILGLVIARAVNTFVDAAPEFGAHAALRDLLPVLNQAPSHDTTASPNATSACLVWWCADPA